MTSFEVITQAGTAIAVVVSAVVQFLKTQNLEKQQVETKKVVDVTKVLVDGTLSSELLISATSARTLATLTKDPAHLLLADQAEFRLKEHLVKMGEVASGRNLGG